MKKKIVCVFVCMLLITVTGIGVARTLNRAVDMTTDSLAGNEENLNCGWYNPTGAWMRSDYRYLMTVTDIGWNKYTTTGEYLNDDPSLWWVGVDAMQLSIIRGDTVRTAKNTYSGKLFAYAVNETYDIVYYVVYAGYTLQTSQNTLTGNFSVAYYSPDQDPFGDDPPEYGLFSGYEFEYERIPYD